MPEEVKSLQKQHTLSLQTVGFAEQNITDQVFGPSFASTFQWRYYFQLHSHYEDRLVHHLNHGWASINHNH